MIILILILVFAGMAFALKSGTKAAEEAATEANPISRTIHHGETGCMGIMFCLLGMAGMLAVISVMFPGR